MAGEQSGALVVDAAALAELARAEELQQRAVGVAQEIRRLLSPVKEQLSGLILEHDRLYYEALAARQEFFQLAKKADPTLRTHGSLHYERTEGQVHVVWDDTGPRYSTQEGAEPPLLHAFERREAARRTTDLRRWLG